MGAGPDLEMAVRDYVRTYAVLHGRPKAAEALGVSRHTLWRFLNRGHTGRAIPRAVLERVCGSPQALDGAKERLILQARARRRLHGAGPVAEPAALTRPLRQDLEEALLLVCAAPLAAVDELSRFGRVPASTLRDRLGKLAKRGLVDSVPHHLGSLGPHPKRRYFPTERGIVAGGRIEHGTEYFLSEYPVSKQWFRLLAERLDAVAVLHRVAAMAADADPTPEARARGPLPPGSLRHAAHSVGGPLHRNHPPGSDAAHVQPALPPQERRADAQQRQAPSPPSC